MAQQLGQTNKLYYDSGTLGGGAEAWTEVPCVTELTVNDTKETGTIRCRDTKFEKSLPSIRLTDFNFTMARDIEDVDYQALRGAYDDDSQVIFKIASGEDPPATGVTISRYILNTYLTGWERAEAFGEFDTVTITASLAANAPDPLYETETGV